MAFIMTKDKAAKAAARALARKSGMSYTEARRTLQGGPRPHIEDALEAFTVAWAPSLEDRALEVLRLEAPASFSDAELSAARVVKWFGVVSEEDYDFGTKVHHVEAELEVSVRGWVPVTEVEEVSDVLEEVESDGADVYVVVGPARVHAVIKVRSEHGEEFEELEHELGWLVDS
jgi:hypothetical protein